MATPKRLQVSNSWFIFSYGGFAKRLIRPLHIEYLNFGFGVKGDVTPGSTNKARSVALLEWNDSLNLSKKGLLTCSLGHGGSHLDDPDDFVVQFAQNGHQSLVA